MIICRKIYMYFVLQYTCINTIRVLIAFISMYYPSHVLFNRLAITFSFTFGYMLYNIRSFLLFLAQQQLIKIKVFTIHLLIYTFIYVRTTLNRVPHGTVENV